MRSKLETDGAESEARFLSLKNNNTFHDFGGQGCFSYYSAHLIWFLKPFQISFLIMHSTASETIGLSMK